MWQYIFWVILFVLALVVEGLTMQLVSIWFAVGSAAALIVSFFHRFFYHTGDRFSFWCPWCCSLRPVRWSAN